MRSHHFQAARCSISLATAALPARPQRMSDFSFVTDDTRLRRNAAGGSIQQPQQLLQRPGQAPQAAGSNAAAPGSAGGGGSRPRIVLPSFREVQAAERASAPLNTFQPGSLGLARHQPPQQQQQQQPQPALGGPANQWRSSSGSSSGAAAPHGAAAAPPAAAPPPSGAAAAAAAAGLSLGLSLQMPRFSQAAGAAGAGPSQGMPRPPAAAATGSGSGPGAPSLLPQQQQQSAATTQRAVAPPSSSAAPPLNAVLVSRRQQGNPVLKHIRSVRWSFADIVPDYLCGANTAVLFLSLRYHLLQPEYVLHRLAALQRAYRLTVLLLLVDVEEVVKPLGELHKAALGADAVLICAWSNEECARYIETLKAYESRPATSIMPKTDTDYLGTLTNALTNVRGVNRSDAYALASKFGSFADAAKATQAEFASVPGLGPVKARRLWEAFNAPFRRTLGGGATAAAGGAARASGAVGSAQPQQPQGAAAAGIGDDRTDADDDSDAADVEPAAAAAAANAPAAASAASLDEELLGDDDLTLLEADDGEGDASDGAVADEAEGAEGGDDAEDDEDDGADDDEVFADAEARALYGGGSDDESF